MHPRYIGCESQHHFKIYVAIIAVRSTVVCCHSHSSPIRYIKGGPAKNGNASTISTVHLKYILIPTEVTQTNVLSLVFELCSSRLSVFFYTHKNKLQSKSQHPKPTKNRNYETKTPTTSNFDHRNFIYIQFDNRYFSKWHQILC